jgi:L-asparaginase/Glu-tRNA(Gln) amidotransferase subunit D
MPDIASALQKVLTEWNTPEAQPAPKAYFTVTNNVTRATFDYIRDNPGKTRKEIAVVLEAKGFKTNSVTSLLGQMVRQGVVRESTGLLYVTTGEYTPLKSAKKLQALAETQQAPQGKVAPIVRKPKAEPTPQINAAWDAETLLNNLSIKQARALYDELRKIFGG